MAKPSFMTESENLTTNRNVGRFGLTPQLIGIHTMEVQEVSNAAENVARAFLNKARPASAHYCGDNNSRVRSVHDKDTAWTLPGANSRSLNYEIAGYAKQTPSDWNDQYSIQALEIAAYTCAEWCKKYSIPVKKLTDAEIRSGNAKGFVGHVDISRVYGKSTHWDPGPGFPWAYFLGRVKVKLAELKGDKTPVDAVQIPTTTYDNAGYSIAYIRSIQTKLNTLGSKLKVDGIRGKDTIAAVKAFQKEHKLDVDGLPGPATKAKLNSVLADLQAKAEKAAANAAKKVSSKKLDLKPLQRAVKASETNKLDSETLKQLATLRASSNIGGVKFPNGVKYAQKLVGTKDDGIWGVESKKAHSKRVVALQKALIILGYNPGIVDGIWGARVDGAVNALKKDLRN